MEADILRCAPQDWRRDPDLRQATRGRLVYDAAGSMSVHIMRSARRHCESETKLGASDAEMKTAYEGCEAYLSMHSVDATRHTIEHKVLGSLFPNWTGSKQTRFYALEATNRFVLSTAPIGALPT